ncbi:nephrin isoform X1 [Sebastes umbrosus]|uniref:nephrin isoform X1 n=2 Tax=Sebastes umbrosus TaxID=72105 RepID=UPI00189F24FF|nr:nephrin isoform X1 [Sebastes umbrosus]XP_037641864.1 nephrin isoform X1 [Sebastes umbrosus]XP_037641865.1 nephrin isoform X1 [Sebastes umbrosus]XP_037641866.1 nephrin isoform X1 [Sebastes umbrosus]XP_037641867.1 nephrin isoform X1 [Sebastes umbrosus]XP_037641868.1 nephrin isoform X1 [Sebastes umbrosus]XP_037641869.1 nephrin isoform X1 [Sebastes umbrosus]XP_037641870.1 nephrin isoform X1 [Sebastes umbrosus]XP_037641871.1 nephrin isoform X1 [Sebastes umbrosus]
MDFFSAWIVSPSALPFLCLIWGTQAQQAFRSEPRNLTVRMGATAVLRCEVLRASGTVQWVKDGLLLGPQRSLPGFPRYSMIGNPKRGQYHLQIEKAQLEDDALYECQAGRSESSPAIISSTAWVDMLIPLSKPYFVVDMATPWVAGEKYAVTCIAPDAKPEAEITLYKDGVELTGAESFTMSGSEDKLLNTHAEVTVTALSSDNGRQLACRAKNPALFRPVETAMTMSVYFPPQPPVIVGLEREEVKAGRVLVLECVSHGGNPLATLHWTKNGEVLSTTWEVDVAAQKSSSILYLKIAPADNQAVVCCESVNLVSLSPLSLSRQITVLFEPAEVTLLGSFVAVEGQDLDLSCYATSSNPPVQIRWWLGYKELNTTVATTEEGDNGGMTTMSNMTHRVSREEDGLKLTCEAFNKGTHFSKTQVATLNVYYPPQKVWLDTPPQDVPLRSGTTVRLICFSTGGNPTGTLTWFKNGKAVTDALRQTSFDRGVARELVLVLAASDNMATYRCDATNKAKKTISAQAKLMVHFPALSMKISTKQKELRRGQTLTLECQSGSSNPRADISWSLGALRFQGVEQPPRRAPFGGVSVHSSLSMNLSSQHHKQRVICQAYSPVLAEGANTFFKLNVLYPPEFSPEQPARVQVVEDDMATIPLLVSANPEEVFCIWLHRREKLVKEGDLRYDWSDENSLEITNVTRRDAGVYTVECSNDEGVNQTSITLDVQYAPSVKAEKDPVLVNLGETADLICVADANPIISDMFSWKWLGEGEVEMEQQTQEDESGLLTIHDVTRAHAGLYQCTANNGIASRATADVQLVVQFKPELQKGAQWSKVASRGDGTTTAKVVCQAEGIPHVDFSWERNGVRMDFANPRYEERTVREGYFHTSTVGVVNVSAALDYAVFSCTARNSLGEDTLDIQLVSTNHPDPPSSFRQVAVSHDSVTLEWIPGFDGGLRQRFRVRYRWDQSASFLYIDVFPPGAATFTVTGLQRVTTYNFSVNALNAMGEGGYADNNAVLTITTEERPDLEEVPPDDDSDSPSASGLPAYLTAVLTAVFGVLLVFNSLGCFFGLRWKKRRGQTGGRGGSVSDGKKNEEEGSSQSTVSNTNKYESREKINAAAQRTLLIDSGSETDSNVYESYAAESSHYYYPTAGDYRPPFSPLPEETRRLDVTHLPVDTHSHLYEDVRDGDLYQDILASPLPSPPSLFDHRLPHQGNEWRSPSYPQQAAERVRDVQQPRRDSDLPFELRGELV